MMRWLNSIFAARRSECSELRFWQMKFVGSFHCEHSIGYHLTKHPPLKARVTFRFAGQQLKLTSAV
jgi:hypothetical protein